MTKEILTFDGILAEPCSLLSNIKEGTKVRKIELWFAGRVYQVRTLNQFNFGIFIRQFNKESYKVSLRDSNYPYKVIWLEELDILRFIQVRPLPSVVVSELILRFMRLLKMYCTQEDIEQFAKTIREDFDFFEQYPDMVLIPMEEFAEDMVLVTFERKDGYHDVYRVTKTDKPYINVLFNEINLRHPDAVFEQKWYKHTGDLIVNLKTFDEPLIKAFSMKPAGTIDHLDKRYLSTRQDEQGIHFMMYFGQSKLHEGLFQLKLLDFIGKPHFTYKDQVALNRIANDNGDYFLAGFRFAANRLL